MKYNKFIKTLIVLIMFFATTNVYAHPGRTDSNGCHYCKTNCASWGLTEGEYHCHGEASSQSNNSVNSNIQTTTITKTEKSSNAKLKQVLIENKEISLKKNMYYETDNEMASIEAIPESTKSKVEIEKTGFLEHGENKIKIIVTAEDQTINTYNLNIVLKSSDADISTIRINDENVNVYKSGNTIEYETSKKTVNIKVVPSNKYARVYYEKNLSLKDGNNKSVIKVVAENGKEKKYTLNIKKTNDAQPIVILIFIIIISIIIYKIYKNKSNNKINKSKREQAYCIKCGKQIKSNDYYCIHCGQKQSKQP